MLKAHSIALAMVLLASVAHADDRKYTVADLRALINQKAYKEAFKHLRDISPSQRNAEWIDLAATASGGVLETLNTDDGSTLAAIDQIDREYPQLLKSEKYTKPRGELGFKGLEGCYRRTSGYWSSQGPGACMQLGIRFVDNSNGDKMLALKVAKLARRNQNSASSIPFFKRAMGAKDFCKDEDTEIAVLAGLALPKEYDNVVAAKEIMNACWDTLKDPVLKAFEGDSKGGYVRQNTCEVLLAKKLISGLNARNCEKP